MSHIPIVPRDIIEYIFCMLDTKTQIRLKTISKSFRELQITRIDNDVGFIITDDALAYFPSLVELNIDNNMNITGEGFKYLPHLHMLNMRGCNNITDNKLKYLPNLCFIDISFCMQITVDGLKHLPSLQTLHV